MKILVVTPFFPYPIHKNGATVRMYNILKELKSKKNKIDMISYFDFNEEESTRNKEKILKFVDDLILIKKPKISLIEKIIKKMSTLPYDVAITQNKETEKIIKKQLEKDYDVIYCDQLSFSKYFYGEKNITKILSPNDLISYFYEKESQKEKNMYKKFKLIIEGIKMKNYENKYFKYFDKVVMVAKDDKRKFEENNNLKESNLVVIPNGVDTNFFCNENLKEIETDEKSIVFTGIMDYLPNKRAVIGFLDEIGGKLEVEGIKFYIVGKNPPKEILELSKKYSNLIITGFVEDIREYIKKGNIYVCPLKTGTGIKNKLLEAMAMSKLIIATSCTADGIEHAKNGENLIVCNDYNDFFRYIVEYIDNKKASKEIGRKARECVGKNYSWDHVVERLVEVMN